MLSSGDVAEWGLRLMKGGRRGGSGGVKANGWGKEDRKGKDDEVPKIYTKDSNNNFIPPNLFKITLLSFFISISSIPLALFSKL